MTPRPDPNAPVVLNDGQSPLRQPPFRPADFGAIHATFSGSIHSPLPAGAFFRHKGFDREDQDGRLYFVRFLNREPGGSYGFIAWTPLDATAQTAQRVVPIPGYSVEDFDTDATVVRVHHYPRRQRKSAILIQKYYWRGDNTGRGRFVLGTTNKGEIAPW